MDRACDVILMLCRTFAGPFGSIGVAGSLAPNVSCFLKSVDVCRCALDQLSPRIDKSTHNENGSPDYNEITTSGTEPFFRFVFSHLFAFHERCWDGGWSFLFYTASLWSNVQRAGIPRRRVSASLLEVRRWLDELFASPVGCCCKLTIDGIDALVASTLHVDWIGMQPQEKDHLRRLVRQALACALHGDVTMPNALRYASYCSTSTPMPALRSTVVKGMLIDWQLPLEAELLMQSSSSRSGAVLLFSCDLRHEECEEDLLRACSAHNVSIVASQRTIDRHLRHALFLNKVLCFERLSIRYASAVESTAGCKVLQSVALLHSFSAVELQSCVGAVTVERFFLGSKEGMRLVGGAASPIHTVVLCAANPAFCNALEGEVKACVRVLCNVLRDGQVVPGGGGFEVFVEQYLGARLAFCDAATSKRLGTLVELMRLTLKNFVHVVCLRGLDYAERETAYLSLCDKCREATNFFAVAANVMQRKPSTCEAPQPAKPRERTGEGVRSANAQPTDIMYGWSAHSGRSAIVLTAQQRADASASSAREISSAVLIDNAACKTQALLEAVGVCSSLLRVRGA